jgi:hypothetical protein
MPVILGGNTGIYLASFTPPIPSPYDPSAQLFFNATGITNPTILTAIDNFVITLKNQNLWSLFYMLHPYVGGTPTTHKFNLINPADTDAAYRLQFFGGLIHSANGITPDGLTGYAETFFTPSSTLNVTDGVTMGFYSRTNLIDSDQQIDMSCNVFNSAPGLSGELTVFAGFSTTFPVAAFAVDFNDSDTYVYRRSYKDPITDTSGFWLGSFNPSTTAIYRNAIDQAGTLFPKLNFRTLPNNTLTIFAQKYQSNSIMRYTKRQLCLTFVAKYMTPAQIATFNSAVQTLEIALSRNV